jgi:hypothetical protein
MKFRKLRIAWSVTWGIVAVLLCFLWLRSFKSMDRLGGPISSTRIILIASINGHVLVNWPFHDWGYVWNMRSTSLNSKDAWPYFVDCDFRQLPDGFAMPQWFPVLVTLFLTASPWTLSRFSLRTLLVATTLLAVVLGLIVWLR